MKQYIFAAVAAVSFNIPASAQDYTQTADPQVLQALNEIIYALGMGCNAGNVNACNLVQPVQTEAANLLYASHMCQTTGDQNACTFYTQSLPELEQAYYDVQAAWQNGSLMASTGYAGAGTGLTHEQRMQQINDMGAQSTARFNQRMQQMDQNHASFLEMIRQ